MKIYFFFALVLLVKAAAGQNAPEIIIPVGSIVSEVLTPEKIYQHPQFALGKVLYRNGTETEALLNYNNLSGSLEFIGPNGDTLVIGKELLATINKILVNEHAYVHQEVYYELVAEHAFGKLLKRQMYLLTNREKMGAYNQFTSLSAISAYDNLTDRTGGVSRSLKVNEKITLTLRSQYFFADAQGRYLPATKKNLSKAFPSRTAQIDRYLSQHDVDFRNVADLTALFSSLK
ncbi:hypothetical protein [Paracnuella aquatica]|uniref:hypothetical protein n=1 Tax=Paracnuella aquatica TaxID=2268757 RepID=UPI000DEF5A89|nr:hypothetical protein [Paracnuella aquatica]RPD45100.1 hypothetical protein DRJ53_15785 [Paracnuella aquatica]